MIFLSIKDRKISMMPPPLAADDEYPLALRKDVSFSQTTIQKTFCRQQELYRKPIDEIHQSFRQSSPDAAAPNVTVT